MNIPNIHDSIRADFAAGVLDLQGAAMEWHRHGHTNYVDLRYARRMLGIAENP